MNSVALTSPTVMDNLVCEGDESGLQDCPHIDGTVTCDTGQEVAVSCDIANGEIIVKKKYYC